MKKKQTFDLNSELQKALDWTLERMKKSKELDPDWDYGYYFSASDLERRVRAAAAEINDDIPYGYYQNYGGGVQIRGLGGLTLLDHCRQFLSRRVRAGELRADQPSGKRTCSGLRFRPADADLTKAEKKTQEMPEEEKTRRMFLKHFQPDLPIDPHVSWGSARKPLCQGGKEKKRRFVFRSKPIRTTGDIRKVTCKNCLRLVCTKLGLRKDTHPGIVGDYVEEKEINLVPLFQKEGQDAVQPDRTERTGEPDSERISCFPPE